MSNTTLTLNKVKRDINADILRVLACLYVIGVHSCGLPETGASAVFFSTLFADGVPIFFMLAGFFMFRKNFRTTLKRTIFHVLIPGLITMLVIKIYYPLYSGATVGECLAGIPAAFVSVGKSIYAMLPTDVATGYLWYILTYFMIVLAFPLLKALCNPNTPSKYRRYIIAMCLLLWFFTDIHTINEAVAIPGLAALLSKSFVYVVAGYEIYQYKDQILGNKKLKWISLGIFILGQILRVMMQMKLFAGEGGRHFIEANNTLPTFICSAALVLFFMSLTFGKTSGKVMGLIAKAGPYTFFVYLVHAPVINQLSHMGFEDWVASVTGADVSLSFIHCLGYFLVRVLVVFVISLLIAFLLKKMTIAFGKMTARKAVRS